MMGEMKITYVGGPTALLEIGDVRLLSDPTFDAAGTEYQLDAYTLKKTQSPALKPDALGLVDAVLLSHDHHFDNLDHSGRRYVESAQRVFTTPLGAHRLSGGCVGLEIWESVDVATASGRILRITGTPARHGPANADRGPVTGFMLAFSDNPENSIYVSGDTVWFDGIAEVAKRFEPMIAVLFMGAARIPAVGPAHLTMTAEEGIYAARAFANAIILPLHFEGWEHLSESRQDIERAFGAVRLEQRLRWPMPGVPTDLVRPAEAA